MKDQWIIQMEEKITQLEATILPTTENLKVIRGRKLRRVSAHVPKGSDQSLYVPRKISFGPYHHGNPSCQQGELDKEQCLINFIIRSQVKLQDCIHDVSIMVDELRHMYEDLDADRWLGTKNTKAFSRMMVLDACYLLEIMHEAIEVRSNKYVPNCVFNPNELENYKHDMLLFDNQIPYKVLQCLHVKCKQKQHVEYVKSSTTTRKPWTSSFQPKIHDKTDSLKCLIRNFFSLSGELERQKEETEIFLHLLHAYQCDFLGGGEKCNNIEDATKDVTVPFLSDNLPSATQLENAQIRMTPSNIFEHQFCIDFFKGNLLLQKISVDGATSSNFHNVILYERLYPEAGMHFSSYIYFLSHLLKDATDSKLLRERGILNTTLHDEQVIELFNGLSHNILFCDDKPMDDRIYALGKSLVVRYKKNLEPWRQDLF